MDLSAIDAQVAEAGFPKDWRTPCAVREAERKEWLKNHWDQDLWVFAYGSLMWDPGFEFAEVIRAETLDFQRSFCLWDEGGRGSVDNPGLMLAIDQGGCCSGLAFRISAQHLDQETFILFRREMIMRAYRPTWLELVSTEGPVRALGFVANRENERIKPNIPLDEQAALIAVATGMLGSNFDYLSDTRRHLQLLGFEDPYIDALYALVCQIISESAAADQ